MLADLVHHSYSFLHPLVYQIQYLIPARQRATGNKTVALYLGPGGLNGWGTIRYPRLVFNMYSRCSELYIILRYIISDITKYRIVRMVSMPVCGSELPTH